MTKKAKSETQLYRLYLLLLNSESGVTKETIVTKLGIKESSVPVYIHSLKKKFGAIIENTTEGRVVTGYILKNEITVPQFKRASVPATKQAVVIPAITGEVPILDREIDAEFSELEFADTVQSLGISTGDY